MPRMAVWTSDETNSNGEYRVSRTHRELEMLDSTQLDGATVIDIDTDVVDDGGDELWLDETAGELHLR